MDAVVALHPDDDFEARLALRIVAMDFHAADSLRSAGLAVDDPEEVRRCRAQAASMARQSDAALPRCCASRPPARSRWRTASRRDGARRLLVQGDRSARPRTATVRRRASDAEPEHTEADIDAEAELYVVMSPDRAERIRAAGGLPARLDFGAPEPEIVARLLRGAGHSAAGTRAA